MYTTTTNNHDNHYYDINNTYYALLEQPGQHTHTIINNIHMAHKGDKQTMIRNNTHNNGH